MPPSLEAGLPALTLTDGYQLRIEARDPTSGAAVGGVNVSDIHIFADAEGAIRLLASTEPLPSILLLPEGEGVVEGALAGAIGGAVLGAGG